MIMLYKKNAVCIPVEPPTFAFNTRGTRGHSLKLHQLPTRIDSYANSFFPNTIEHWNNLPLSATNINSLDNFKSIVSQQYLCN